MHTVGAVLQTWSSWRANLTEGQLENSLAQCRTIRPFFQIRVINRRTFDLCVVLAKTLPVFGFTRWPRRHAVQVTTS
jgi:hypothetical protein